MKRLKLIPDREYLFTHKRKGTFRAEFKRLVRAPSTDTIDELYYECEVDSALSANPWSQTQEKAVVLVRPSLVTVIQNVPAERKVIPQQTPFGQGRNLVRVEVDWKTEYAYRLRCIFWDLRRMWSKQRKHVERQSR